VAEVIGLHVRRSTDLVARYGGEEFAFISPGVDEAHALATAQSVCAALRARMLPDHRSPFAVLTASIGMAAIVPAEDYTPDMLVRRADAALYEAKRRSRNQVVLADEPVLPAT